MLRYGTATLLKRVVQTTLFKSIVTADLFLQCIGLHVYIKGASPELNAVEAHLSGRARKMGVSVGAFLKGRRSVVVFCPIELSIESRRTNSALRGVVLLRASYYCLIRYPCPHSSHASPALIPSTLPHAHALHASLRQYAALCTLDL